MGVAVGFYVLIIITFNRNNIHAVLMCKNTRILSMNGFYIFIFSFHEILLIFSLPQNKR